MKKNKNIFRLIGKKRLKKFWMIKNFIILFFALNLSVQANGFAQKIAVVKYINASIEEVFDDLKNQTGYGILYKKHEIDSKMRVSLELKNADVQKVLNEVLEGTGLVYVIQDEVIVIYKAPLLSESQQQKHRVQGKVSDEKGNPLPGVSVVVKGTTLGVATDVNGAYSLEFEGSDAVLVYSFIGFNSQEVNVAGRSQINITLQEEQVGLEEVVVTGYGTITKEAYTGSAAVVSSKKIEERAVASFQDVLRGNSPGTLVTGTGQPGVNNAIRLRGISSMNASNSPLYVIDGMILDVTNMSGDTDFATNPLNTINPSDIESVTVLKDAASASLYGSRGANGVIVITTKQGKERDKPLYSLDMQFGASKPFYASRPDFVNKDEFVELWLEGEMHYQISRKTSDEEFFSEVKKLYADKENYQISGRNYHDWYQYAQEQFNDHFKIGNPEGGYYDYDFFNGDEDKLADVNWFDEVTRTAPFQKFNFSVQGGSNAMNYYASLGYLNQEGILIGSGLKRYSLKMNLSSKPKNTLIHWGLNNTLSYADQAGPRANANGYAMPQYTAFAIAPVAPVYLDDGSYNLQLPKGVNNNNNPVAVSETNTYERPQTKIMTSGWMQVNFTDWLYLNSRANLDYTHARRREWRNKDFGDGNSVNGSLYERDARKTKLSNTNLLHFNKSFNEIHNLNAYVGTEVEDVKYEYVMAEGINFPTNDTPYLGAAATPESIGGSGSGYGMFSLLSSVSYSMDGKYYLSGSFRSDESSRFAKEHRKGNFWSVSGAWRISREAFMEHVSFVNDLKIKTSFGTNGTLPSEYYAWQALYAFGSDYMGQSGAVIPDIPNRELTWEENKVFNIGFDARLFGRISLGLEYYNRTTQNLLQEFPVSSTSGFTKKLINSAASLKNSGIELDLNVQIIQDKQINWNVNLNLASLHNEFSGLETDIISGSSTQIRRNGESMYTWYMPEWAGTDPETGEQRWFYTDEAGNNAITKDFDEAEKRILGKGLPTLTGGFSNTLSWKDLELSFLFTYALGHKVMDYTGRSASKNDGYRDYRSIERDQLDRWTPDNPTGKNPIRVNTSSTWDRYKSSRYLHKGDYLKMKNIKLQYSMPSSFTELLKLSSANVFVQAENLFVLSALKGFDPEISLSGFRYPHQYPTATTYTLGVKVNF